MGSGDAVMGAGCCPRACALARKRRRRGGGWAGGVLVTMIATTTDTLERAVDEGLLLGEPSRGRWQGSSQECAGLTGRAAGS
jgi:hypothetical protein